MAAVATGAPCEVCGRPIPSADPRRVTCGHPRCRRTRERQRRTMSTPADTATLVRRALDNGASPAAAFLAVAQATGEPVATVMGVWQRMGER